MKKKKRDNLFFILSLLIATLILVLTLLIGSAQTCDMEKFKKLIGITLEKGTFIEKYECIYLKKFGKINETTEKRLYFSVYCGVIDDKIFITHIACIEELWVKVMREKQIIFIIKQKIAVDGGEFGQLDGQPDRFSESEIIEDEYGLILDLQSKDFNIMDVEALKWHDEFIEEMFAEMNKK